jgi:hypothetical protein
MQQNPDANKGNSQGGRQNRLLGGQARRNGFKGLTASEGPKVEPPSLID